MKKPVGISLDQQKYAEFRALCKSTGIPVSRMVEEAFDSIIRYYHQHGMITLPLEVVPTSKSKASEAAVHKPSPETVTKPESLRRTNRKP